MAKKKQYPLVEVTWYDAEERGDVGWNDFKEQLAYAKKPLPLLRSVGYVVYRNEHHIALVSTLGEHLSSTLEKIPMSFVHIVTPLFHSNGENDTTHNPVKKH
jgi:hypothetical protein